MSDHRAELALASQHYEAERFHLAERICRSIVSGDPQCAGAWRLLAWLAVRAQRADIAIEYFDKVAVLNPTSLEAWANLGQLHRGRGQWTEAVVAFRRADALMPNHPPFVSGLALSLKGSGHREEAVAICERALRVHPNHPDLHSRLGNLLQESDRLDEAVEHLTHALQLEPNAANHASNLGIAYHRRGELEEAERCFRQALALRPDAAETRFHLAMPLLLQGNNEAGWPEYEWRVGGTHHLRRTFPKPLWMGEPLEGRTLLLVAEQGLGDTVQFVGFLEPLRRLLGARTALVCQPALKSLLQSCPHIDVLLGLGEELPEYDYALPLLSLGARLHGIPGSERAPVPYLFADPALVERWAGRLPRAKVRVGIGWQGDPTFPADRSRSIPLTAFRPLWDIPGVSFVSLQKGPGVEQLAQLAPPHPILDLGDELDCDHGPFMDTAAIARNLDLVITSDTALAHVVGALGVPVWIAVPFVPDWRWLLETKESPWYPSATLFRQPKLGNWDGVVVELREALRAYAEAKV